MRYTFESRYLCNACGYGMAFMTEPCPRCGELHGIRNNPAVVAFKFRYVGNAICGRSTRGILVHKYRHLNRKGK